MKFSGSDYLSLVARHRFTSLHTILRLGSNERGKIKEKREGKRKGKGGKNHIAKRKKKKKKKKKKQVRAHRFWHGDPCAVTFVYRIDFWFFKWYSKMINDA